MANNQDLSTSQELTTKEIIDNWNRAKYPSFQDYLKSAEFQELKVTNATEKESKNE